MNKRVFHVDQECFLVYAEELSNKKERFLRIGNSPFLKEVESKLTFITLLSDILPGDPIKEIEIFKKNKSARVIGLNKITSNFIEFLKNNKINTENIKVIIAEKEEKLFKEIKNEIDLFNKIKENNSIKNHSFASFYGDGNIKVFNRNEIVFDLKEGLNNTVDNYTEIKLSSNFFKSGYDSSYHKNGIIHSNKSLFVFSNNNFACITESSAWTKDAVRVGINPSHVELIYASSSLSSDDIDLKPLFAKDNDEKTTLLSKKKPDGLTLIQNKNIKYADPSKEKINYKAGVVNISFEKDLIKIFNKNTTVILKDEELFLDKGKEINIEYFTKGNKVKSSFVIEGYSKDSLTLYSYNPIIFQDLITDDNYIKNFWDEFPKNTVDEITDVIKTKDGDYLNYFPETKDKSFHSRLFLETIRRIENENNKNIDDAVLDKYKSALRNFNGEVINENNIIIEQTFGFNINANQLCMRDVLGNNNFVYLNNEINPFLIFKNEVSREKWESKLKKYRESYKKNVNDEEKEKSIRERFTEILESKRFYVEEQNRLRRFIEDMIIKERQKEKTENKERSYLPENYNKTNSENETDIKQDSKDKKERKLFIKGKNKKFKIFIFSLILLLILLLALFFAFFINSDFSIIKKYATNKIIKKTEEIKKEDSSYKIINNFEERKIIEINIKITIIDVLNFTNLVAEKNGYHKIVDEKEKDFIAGNDPDWIFPNNTLVLPDDTKIVVKENDNMWNLSEDYLTKEAKEHELKLNEILFEYKENKIDLNTAKEKLEDVKSESHLNNLKKAVDDLLKMDDLKDIAASM